jgi:hypothetical protein
MAVLTKLSQFEQYDLEELVCDAIQCLRGTASKVVAEVFVPELEKRLHSARRAQPRRHRLVPRTRADRHPRDRRATSTTRPTTGTRRMAPQPRTQE